VFAFLMLAGARRERREVGCSPGCVCVSAGWGARMGKVNRRAEMLRRKRGVGRGGRKEGRGGEGGKGKGREPKW